MAARLMVCAAAILPALMLGGCAAKPRGPHAQIIDPPAATLVLPGSALLDLESAHAEAFEAEERLAVMTDPWYLHRNDERLGSPPWPQIAAIEFLEIHQRDYLRTVNGRPREFSTTFIKTTRRGVTY
jgi:hypothetical protein